MIKIYAGTDKGRVRSINQDAYNYRVLESNAAYAVLCDGMGGESGGHIASAKAVELLSQALEKGLTSQTPDSSIKSLLTSAVSAANAVIYEMAAADETLRGMGTTVVAAVIRGNLLCIAHAGDSRAYLLGNKGKLRQLTHDHSVVQFLLDAGKISPSEARVHPKRNYITRALGIERTVEVEYTELSFVSGHLLLCSDGLYNFAPPPDHIDLIATCNSEQDLYLLIDEANKAGGADNITAIIVSKQDAGGTS